MIDGVQYLVWAQRNTAIEGNSNLYIAKMANPWTLGSEPVMLTKRYDWECIDFLVNEGPAFLFHENKIYITYSASGTEFVRRGAVDRRARQRSAGQGLLD